jgi:hypothetical protein
LGSATQRAFNIDITVCPLCGGYIRIIADITDPDIIQKILHHIEPQPPPLKPATAIQSLPGSDKQAKSTLPDP